MTTSDAPPSAPETMPPVAMSHPLTVDQLADVLHEPNIPLLRQVLQVLGVDRTARLLVETLQCETTGGMLTQDGTRRRTPGGTFFHLARQQASPRERARLFPPGAATQAAPRTPQAPTPLTWEEAHAMLQIIATEPPGEARTMKLTLIGRPGKVEVRPTCVIFRLQGKPPGSLPKGLPPVPAQPPMTWTVIVALRQWNRVKDSLAAHQDDQLILDGYPLIQSNDTPMMLVQSCVSLLQQRAQKQAQQHQAETTP
jgi:hypothetical protein